MPIPVSAAFTAAESADVNSLARQVYLLLGNYASAAGYGASASSSGDKDTNYPAAGAIDDDRTEINRGPAAGADNYIGKSTWMSSNKPDASASGSVWLEVNFNAERTFNRIKLYQRAGHGLKSYAFFYDVEGTWQPFAGTPDIIPILTAWGTGFYGAGIWGGDSGVATTGALDELSGFEITAQRIRLEIYNCQIAADWAEVVELEVYRAIDITDYVKTVKISRARDYKLGSNIASTLTLDCHNSDRFLSPSYTPTAAEVASGFVNSELRPNIGVEVYLGYDYGGLTEVVRKFTGYVDSIKPSSKSRACTIECRDGTKRVIDAPISSGLKTAIDNAEAIRYLLNRCNFSDFEMSLDQTTIKQDYFFVEKAGAFTTIQQLVQASGDAAFYFDENGTATLKMYMSPVPQEYVTTTQAQFQAGTVKTNIDTDTYPDSIVGPPQLIDSFPTGSLSKWSVLSGTCTGAVGSVTVAASGPNFGLMSIAHTEAYGEWYFLGQLYNAGAVYIGMDANTHASGVPSGNGYALIGVTVGPNTFAYFVRIDAGAITNLIITAVDATVNHGWRITRSGAGLWTIYADNTPSGTATDNTYTTSAYMLLGGGATPATFANIYWQSSNTARFESAIIDLTANVTALDNFMAQWVLPAGFAFAWETNTSADGLSWDGWVSVTPGGAIGSTLHRYIKWGVTITGPTTNINPNPPNIAQVFDATIQYQTNPASSRYPASPSYTWAYDGVLLDVDQELTDVLGGDSSIINDVSVTAAPLVLTGADTDTTWQGTNGTPPASVAADNALSVAVGTLVIPCYVSGGMDTSRMGGSNPAAAVVTFGSGGAGTWTIQAHPTAPVLTIVVSTAGTITDLRLIGKRFAATDTPFAAVAESAQSIALNGLRSLPIDNAYIINGRISAAIATRIISLFLSPTHYLPRLPIRPTYSLQINDRATITDLQTGIAADYYVSAIDDTHGDGDCTTTVQAIKI